MDMNNSITTHRTLLNKVTCTRLTLLLRPCRSPRNGLHTRETNSWHMGLSTIIDTICLTFSKERLWWVSTCVAWSYSNYLVIIPYSELFVECQCDEMEAGVLFYFSCPKANYGCKCVQIKKSHVSWVIIFLLLHFSRIDCTYWISYRIPSRIPMSPCHASFVLFLLPTQTKIGNTWIFMSPIITTKHFVKQG